MKEPLQALFTDSKVLILDFDQIPHNLPPEEDIQAYFKECESAGINPRLPSNRQEFNNRMLAKTKKRYIVSRYGEDRSAMLAGSTIIKESRNIHLGVDIFCRRLEKVYAPCDGSIIAVGQETEDHSFGHYLIFRPKDSNVPYIFFGHLGSAIVRPGNIKEGDLIATIGDYTDGENGGWSRHLHLQMLKEMPQPGKAPIGYSSHADFKVNRMKFPDPMPYFPQWHIN